MSNSHKKIKIVFMIDQLEIGGTEKQLLKMIELLDRQNFEPTLICLKPSKYFSEIKLPCESKILNVYSLISFHSFITLIKFVRCLYKNKIDIVQTYFFDSTFFGVISAKFAGVPVIISCKRDLGFWHTKGLLVVLKIINHLVDKFLVNSEAIKNHIAQYESIPLRKFDVIYNGIETKICNIKRTDENLKQHYNIPDNHYVVGIVANLNRQVKRVDVFIKAAAEIVNTIDNVSFIIVGDGSLKDGLRELGEELNSKKNIIFIGLQDDIYPFISLFDVGVLSSDSEGFSNSILEYMSLGIPVVATDVGGNSEIIQEDVNGILVAPGDYHCMAENICKLLSDRELRFRLGGNGKRLIKKKHSWDIIIREFENYYYKLIGNE